MLLKSISLQNFRSYTKSEFSLSKDTTLIVGPNTSGKTNLIEAIYILATGKSFRTSDEVGLIHFGEDLARASGTLTSEEPILVTSEVSRRDSSEVEFGETDKHLEGEKNSSETYETLEVLITLQAKKYLVNGVSKRRVDFAGNLKVVLFSPTNLDIVIGSPSHRREFLNEVLEQVDREYRIATTDYSKALRQRNALLENVQKTGIRNEKRFEYWDELLISTGQLITKKREEFIAFINSERKDVFNLQITYDKSVISKDRLLQYKDAEVGAGVTLVGPHRDDFLIRMYANGNSANESELKDVKVFGSRGQQRLVVLQLKLLQLSFMEKTIAERPLLLLDDIFSELDESHINHVLKLISSQQTIITTTHREFIPEKFEKEAKVIELKLS